MDLATLWPVFDEEDESYDEFGEGGPAAADAEPATVTFPVTNLVTRVQIALGADLSADPLTWNWLDITEWVRYDLGISLTVNRRDEQTTATTGTAQMKLDNRDGRFTRRNPTGPYYGLLSKNTPIWATINAGSGEKTRLEMFVNEWPKDWSDKSAVDSTVTIRCAGVLRRLQQGLTLKSPLRRAILTSSPVAYWPLEDGSDATEAASAIGGPPMTVVGTVDFGAVTDLVGAVQTPDTTAGMLTGFLSGASATSWHVEFLMKGAFIASAFARLLTSSSGFSVFRFNAPSAVGQEWRVLISDSGGSTTAFLIGSTLATAATQNAWHHVALSAAQVGASVVTKLYVDGVLEVTDTTAGTLAAPHTVLANQNYLDGTVATSMAHIAIGDGATISGAAAAVDAYTGEQAHIRIARLCGEEDIVYQSSAPESPAMGPQLTGTLLSLLRDAEAVGGGVLHEKRWGLAYQSVVERYNQSVGMALDFAQGQIADIPRPADDDQRTRNRFTASRPNGSEYTAEQTDGPMGTGAQGPGVYDDSATLNVETDNQLSSQAGWRIHLGTIDEDRWPDVGLNFAHDPDLIDTWCALGYGARITLANPLPQMPPDPPDLIIEGHSERWDQRMWTASLNCSPASAYRVNVVGSTDGNQGRVDAANSTLVADVSDVGTTLSVASPAALWRTGAVNFDIEVGGEQMTVTNISGGSSPQTFTVTRSVNGIVKAQPASVGGFATRVRLWKPAKVAL